ATSTGPPASLFRNTGPFTSRSQHRVGLPPQNLVEVTPTASFRDGFDGPDQWQRQQDLRVALADATAEAARLGKAVKAKAAAAKAAKAAKASRAAKDATKARAVAAQIEAVEAAMDAERARVALFDRTHPRPSTAATEAVKTWAAAELTRMGYEPEQFICLDQLWTRESGWNPFADNPTSTAYGIPQSLPGTKMASAGADWLTNPRTQITWGLGYIKARYVNPCRAWAHSESVNWY
ncbi:MAG: lytic transglycosylase domain-containing protein, partial [Chloroflexota bacterium]|nr:lytic transglycosylase domain-containing protein [Chloroflexota bacterium]